MVIAGWLTASVCTPLLVQQKQVETVKADSWSKAQLVSYPDPSSAFRHFIRSEGGVLMVIAEWLTVSVSTPSETRGFNKSR